MFAVSRLARVPRLQTRSFSLFSGSFSSPFSSPVSSLLSGLIQKRFKSRGNTYQPSTIKRKRTFGFLARLRTKGGQKVLQRRKAKGRWYLTH